MLSSAGKGTKGRGNKGDIRRTIVLSFLAGCKSEELSLLFDLITEPFTPILNGEMRAGISTVRGGD